MVGTKEQAIGQKTTYLQDYNLFKAEYNESKASIDFPDLDLVLYNLSFSSPSELIFPSDTAYYAPKLCGSTLNLDNSLFGGAMADLIKLSDEEISQNKDFNYIILKKKSQDKISEFVFMFHGLNEKDWLKYLPWAKKIVGLTGKAVVLFPIAFHMDRAYPDWHHGRLMNEVAQQRKALFQHINNTSFTNAAMSTRLHFAPVRFFLSGLETYHDVIHLIEQIKSGSHPHIHQNAAIDLFGYSAGAFLVQILLMADRNEYFNNSRGVLFCGGPLLSRMYLTSRYIMDSEAHQAIRDFYLDNFDRNLQDDPTLKALFEATNKGGVFFRSMLSESYGNANQLRKQRLEELQHQISAISLKNDDIMPTHEIQASLIGTKGSVVIPVKEFDFEYKYSHVNPFPNLEKVENQVDQSFENLFGYVAECLG